MASRTLKALLHSTVFSFKDLCDLAIKAESWRKQLGQKKFNKRHYEKLIEVSYLNIFITWESFLEESFTLYLLGSKSQTGFSVARYVMPTNRQHAAELMRAQSRFIDWTDAQKVIQRARIFFKNGGPFVKTIEPQQNLLEGLRTIRNAIAHNSTEAQGKFEKLVRQEITYYPAGMSPGAFLVTLKRGVSPPLNYLTFYSNRLELMAQKIAK